MHRISVYIIFTAALVLASCQSQYKTSSATLPHKDRKSTDKEDKKELEDHLDKQAEKQWEVDDLEHKYNPPSKRKKRGEAPTPETYY